MLEKARREEEKSNPASDDVNDERGVMPILRSSNVADGTASSEAWSEKSFQETVDGWGLTEEETEALRELGYVRLVDVRYHSWCAPDFAVRFLLASYWDVDKAEAMFRNMLQWREDHNVDELMSKYTPPKIIKDNYPGAILKGTDYEGDPVYMSRLGVTDVVGMFQQFGPDEMYKFEIYKREAAITGRWITDYEKEQGRRVKQVVIVEDMEGLSSRLLNRAYAKFFEDVLRFDQDNYCEVTKKIIVLRASKIFRVAWSVAKTWVDPLIREKIIFTSPQNYVEILSQYMDPSILPPAVYPEGGRGGAVDDDVFSPNFEGGLISELIQEP